MTSHCLCGVLCFVLVSIVRQAAVGDENARFTPTVGVIEKVNTAIVPVFVQTGEESWGAGSGAVVHKDGFLLTADHVTRDFQGVALFGLDRAPFEIAGRLPERDLAVLKVDASKVKAIMRLGRSHDVRAGEPIVVAGNPSGRGIVFAQGIVNAPSIDPSWPSVLAKSFWRTEAQDAQESQTRSTGGRQRFIQFDASSNRGNSGGPLVNFDGSLIGVVAHKSFEEEGISWAIPIDRVRLWFPYLMQPEEVGGFWTGIEMDMLSDRALVSQVLENSPAWSVGIRAGDAVIAVDGRAVKIGPDWPFALHGHKPGDRLKIRYERNGNQFERDVTLDENASFRAASGENKEPGLSFALYRGRYAELPDFGKLESIKQGVIRSIQADEIVSATENAFAIVFSGYVEFPQAGQYRLQLSSDDGSKLYLDGRLIIDNDLPHPYQQLSRWVRVPKGLVPIRVEYSETGGARALKFDIKQGYDPANAMELPFFHDKSTPK